LAERNCTGDCDEGGAPGGSERWGRERLQPAQRSTSVMWKLCVAVTLSLALPRGAGAAGVAFFDGGPGQNLKIFTVSGSGGVLTDNVCDAQTPPDKFVFPVKCTLTNIDTLAVSCDSIAFSIVVNQTHANEPVDTDYVLTEANFDNVGSCNLPGSGLSAEICEQNYVQSRCGLQKVSQKRLVETTGSCDRPLCLPDDRDLSTASCSCQFNAGESTDGTCACLHWHRYSLKPIRFTSIEDSAVCFSAPLRAGGKEERCVYLDMTIAPYSLMVSSTGSVGSPVDIVQATVGQPLTLTVFAEDLNVHQTVSINLQPSITSEKPSVELPRQRWLTETAECSSNLKTEASVGLSCVTSSTRGATWRRQIIYTPVISESGMTYQLNLQASDNGLDQAMLADTSSNYQWAATLGGTACGPNKAGLCSPAPLTIAPQTASITVQVQQVMPEFDAPPEGDVANAYPNCPMTPIPIKVFKANAQLEMSLTFGSTPADVAAGHLYGSAADLGFTSQSSCVKDAKDQHRYTCPKYGPSREGVAVLSGMTLQWTPPLEAAGTVYKVCSVVQDDAPSVSTRCFTISVKRCMYCTDTESLSHLATRFRTNWVQIWSANDPDWVTANAQSLAASQVKAWAATDHPHQLEQGTLVRLGPVYITRAELAFEELARRFQTTVWALLELNPDLAHLAQDSAPIPIGQEVCVLPGICTGAQGMSIDA